MTPAPEAPLQDERPAPKELGSPETATPVAVSVPAVPPVTRPVAGLDGFYDALDQLRAGERDRVRVLWLGDSHTAADFLTHPVREHLQMIAGDGGPGFVRVGLDGYRHGAVRIKNSGRWRKQPILPSQRTRVLDGVFGYGGIRTLPAAGSNADVSLRSPDEGVPVVWSVSYRLGPGAGLAVALGEHEHTLRASGTGTGERDVTDSALHLFDLRAPAEQGLTLRHYSGDPEVFGVFAEYDRPGLVLDTVGINGARLATPLAWEPDAYVAEVDRRNVDLLVLAFGTNEVFDQGRTAAYEEHVVELVDRIRRGQPELPCWVVGPPDSATPQGGTKPRVLEVESAQKRGAERVGCGFTSQLTLMGGEGSFYRWMNERPTKARTDRIHLSIAGYRFLGQLLAEALVLAPPVPDPTEGGDGDGTLSLPVDE